MSLAGESPTGVLVHLSWPTVLFVWTPHFASPSWKHLIIRQILRSLEPYRRILRENRSRERR